MHTLTADTSGIITVGLRAGGYRVVAAFRDGTLKVWDLETAEEGCALTGHRAEVTAVALTPDGCRAVFGSKNGTLGVWDPEKGGARMLMGPGAEIAAVALTPDGRRAVSSADLMLKVWDLDQGKNIATFHCDAKIRSCFCADEGRIFVAADDAGSVHLLRLEE